MYIMKICKDKQILAINHYKYFENAMSDVANGYAFECIPNHILKTLGEWGDPRISCHSFNDETGMADDFEFVYPCGVIIYIGTIMVEEDTRLKK